MIELYSPTLMTIDEACRLFYFVMIRARARGTWRGLDIDRDPLSVNPTGTASYLPDSSFVVMLLGESIFQLLYKPRTLY